MIRGTGVELWPARLSYQQEKPVLISGIPHGHCLYNPYLERISGDVATQTYGELAS
jgi:hypothetical protein